MVWAFLAKWTAQSERMGGYLCFLFEAGDGLFLSGTSAGLPHKVSASVSKDKNTAGADHSAPAVHLEVKNKEVN